MRLRTTQFVTPGRMSVVGCPPPRKTVRQALRCGSVSAARSQPARIESPDRHENAEDDGLRARWAAGNVDVHGEDPVDAPGARVTLPDDAPRGRTGSHGDHDARVW